MLTKEQNKSNQSSLLMGPNGFLNSSKIMYLVLYLKEYGHFDLQKCLQKVMRPKNCDDCSRNKFFGIFCSIDFSSYHLSHRHDNRDLLLKPKTIRTQCGFFGSLVGALCMVCWRGKSRSDNQRRLPPYS